MFLFLFRINPLIVGIWKWDQDDRLGKHWALSPSYININILFENDLRLAELVFYNQRLQRNKHIGWYGREAIYSTTFLADDLEEGKISQSWASPLRARSSRYQGWAAAVKSGTGKMSLLLPGLKAVRLTGWL